MLQPMLSYTPQNKATGHQDFHFTFIIKLGATKVKFSLSPQRNFTWCNDLHFVNSSCNC